MRKQICGRYRKSDAFALYPSACKGGHLTVSHAARKTVAKDRRKPDPPQSTANGSHLTTAALLARHPQGGSRQGLLLATLPRL